MIWGIVHLEDSYGVEPWHRIPISPPPAHKAGQSRGSATVHLQDIPHHVTAQVDQAPGYAAKHHPICIGANVHVHKITAFLHKIHQEALPHHSGRARQVGVVALPCQQPGHQSHPLVKAPSFPPYLDWDNQCLKFRHGGGGGGCQNLEYQLFVWYSPFSLSTQSRIVSSSNPKGDVTINNLELGALLMQLLIFPPRMAPLVHIHTYVNNISVHVWDNQGSIIRASEVGTILREIALAARWQHIHASIGCVPGEENKMSDAASRITHLPNRQFLSHFHTHFLQSNTWRLLPL